MVTVLVLDDDQQMVDEWGYVLPALGVPPENCFFPLLPEKRLMRHQNATDPIPQDKHLLIFSSKNGEYMQGKHDLTKALINENWMLVFGPTHGFLTPELLDDHLSDWQSRHDLIYIPHSPTWELHGPNAGAVALYEYRRQHGWSDH